MRSGNDEGAARQRPQSSSNNTFDARQHTTYALATVNLTRTTRGGTSALLLVECPFDRTHLHLHRAPLDFRSGKRRAGCGGGSYVVHTGAVETGQAAA